MGAGAHLDMRSYEYLRSKVEVLRGSRGDLRMLDIPLFAPTPLEVTHRRTLRSVSQVPQSALNGAVGDVVLMDRGEQGR